MSGEGSETGEAETEDEEGGSNAGELDSGGEETEK